MTGQPRPLPTDVVEARLNHLIDRARRGRLLHEEADRFTTELRDLVRRMEDTEDERDRAEATVARVRQAVDAGPVGSCCAHLIHAALKTPAAPSHSEGAAGTRAPTAPSTLPRPNP